MQMIGTYEGTKMVMIGNSRGPDGKMHKMKFITEMKDKNKVFTVYAPVIYLLGNRSACSGAGMVFDRSSGEPRATPPNAQPAPERYTRAGRETSERNRRAITFSPPEDLFIVWSGARVEVADH